MGRISSGLHAFNSFVRTLLFAALVGAAALGGWKAYSIYNEPQQKLDAKQRELDSANEKLADLTSELDAKRQEAAALAAEVKAKQAEIVRLETSVRLLKLRHRIARLVVTDQEVDADTGKTRSKVEFFEVNDEGAPISEKRQEFEIVGDRVYVECLVAKFDDKYVEQNDLDRRTAICLFQRIFGEYQEPQQGFAIDQVGTAPSSYARGGEMSDFEKRIWKDFWTLANDPQQAAELGIRALHADAPSVRVREDAEYELELRSTGEFTLRPISQPTQGAKAADADS